MKILFASHSPQMTTSYARVTAQAARAAREAGHEVRIVGLTDDPGPGSTFLDIQVISTRDLNAAIAPAVSALRPDLLITIGDPWMFPSVPALRRQAEQLRRWLAYFPIDGDGISQEWAVWIRAADVPVVYCEYTADVVERAMKTRPFVVPLGVDTSVFVPGDKRDAKRRVGVEGRFVVGTVAINQQRKNIPALIRAFKTFAKDKPDAVLYLHTAMTGYWDIDELVRRLGIFEKTRATLNYDARRGVSDEVMATLYNAFDLFVLPTMGEGFGLPLIESQACGTPALATDCSACTELLPDPRQRLAVKATLIMGGNIEQSVVDEQDIIAKLNDLYQDRAQVANLGRNGRSFAQAYDWRRIIERFMRLIGSTV